MRPSLDVVRYSICAPHVWAWFSRDAEGIATWYARQHDRDWAARRRRTIALLGEADRLQSVADLVGASALPDRERVVLLTARLIREAVLQQSALSRNDASCAPAKQAALLEAVLAVHDRALSLLTQGISASAIEEMDVSDLIRARERGGPADAASVAPAPIGDPRAAGAPPMSAMKLRHPPERSGRLWLEHRLAVAKRGYELLEEKRHGVR